MKRRNFLKLGAVLPVATVIAVESPHSDGTISLKYSEGLTSRVWNNDGTKLYVHSDYMTDAEGPVIHEYALTTPHDEATAVHVKYHYIPHII